MTEPQSSPPPEAAESDRPGWGERVPAVLGIAAGVLIIVVAADLWAGGAISAPLLAMIARWRGSEGGGQP